jgi:YD repeat-containing protein
MHRPASAPRSRLVHLLVCLSLLAHSLIPVRAAAAPAGRTTGKPSPAVGTAAAVRQEAEAADLPDLEEVRRRPHREPKAVPPVPSTRRRCPPRNPRCNDDLDGAPQATPTPVPTQHRPGRGNLHAASTAVEATPATTTTRPPARDLASVNVLPLRPLWREGAGLPVFDFSLLDFYRSDGGYGSSDVSAAGPLAGLGRGYGGAFPLVQGAANLAQGKATTQSSTLVYNPPGDSWRAVDGNTDGNYMAGTVTHTNGESQPWWQVDLGGVQSVGTIHLWNRTDCCADRLANYYVFVSEAPFASTDPAQTQAQAGVWTSYTAGQAPTHATITANRTGRYVRVQLAGTGILSLAEVQVFTGEPQVVPPQGIPPAESVAWTNAGGVTASGNSLTKPGASGWGDAGAMSTKAVASGDGYVEFTASETNTYRMLGLSHGDSNRDYADIDFAIYPAADGQLYVYEAGVGRGGFGPYATGDRLRVSVAGGTVSYSKNGTTVYTSGVAPRYPLLVDAALYSTGATINNTVISGSLVENVVWANVAGVTAWGNNLTKGGSLGWNGGASSTRVIAGGEGYAEFTALETSTPRMFGLSRGDSNQIYTDIDYAIYPYSDGTLHVYESGTYKAYLGGYASGDRLRVSVEGGQVRYRRNGALLYTSATPPQYPLLVDTSLHDPGATIHNAVISAPLPSQTDPGGIGLTGRYYDNIDFTNYVTTRLDYTVDYWWDLAAPVPGVGSEEFSVRWTGMVVPRYSETYTFYTTTDDGVRLWVDGQLIINKWQDQGATEWSGQVTLEAGRAYAIKLEFYDRFWGAVAQLRWSSASQAKEIIPQSRLLPCWKGVEQFVTDFYQAVLRRQPTSHELQDWTERLAQAQGEAAQIAAAQALGYTLFAPAIYDTLNPPPPAGDNSRFVSDLYWGFLQRAPDAGGHAWWVQQVTSHGRGTGVAAFADSIEFKEKVARLCGTSSASGTNGGDGYNFAAARLDPVNRTGSGGADPYSRNYNFNIPLVSLPGRAGLDLGLTLTYNSLVWTKDGTGVTFDADRGTPSPGFRLGFPSLQPKFYNPQAQKNAYLLVTPSGARVELRQVGTTSVYESVDSSYLQLTEVDMTLRSTDGTQLAFTGLGGEWRCYLVKDRNGNYISAAYYGDGRLQVVTDTLGRVLTFNYDNYQNLLSITQPWRRDTEANPNPTQDETHSWATFGYTNVTLLPQFSNLAVMGEQAGTVIPALSQVGLPDGSYYKFSYNEWGQVWKVTHFAADSVTPAGQPNDSHPLSFTRLNLPGSDLQAASAQTDCPRFTQEKTWIENGVMNQSAEVTTSYGTWTANMASCDVTVPDGTIYRSLYETSGWKRGLTAESQVWSGGVKKKWTTLTWDQDAPAAAYRLNPRVTETVVHDDSSNHRRATTSYQSFTPPVGGAVTLPQEIIEYKEDTTTVLRTTRTEYNLSADYTGRRIIGLPGFQYVYEGTSSGGTLLSKAGYVYDDNTLANYLQGLPTAATQHDGTNYGGTFRWRGNVSRVRRYDVTGGAGTYVEGKAGYYVTGTAAFTKDASDHQTSLSYTDSFFQGISRAAPSLQTYAYPTTTTDPDGFTTSASYNYDMGMVRESRTPLPNVTTNQPGPLNRRYYDAAGRVVKSLNTDTNAYTRTAYPAKMDAVLSYVLIEAGVEAYSAQVLDGVGRTRATARSLPGSTGGYAGQVFDLNSMGRVARQSNPTETNAGAFWAATGDDVANGWLYTQTTYDWQGRPLVITHPKVNPADANEQPATREFEYGGCGCAGGEVVTERGELVPKPGTSTLARRVRKTYSDILGRPWKSETLDWDGNVYATTTTKYNALDRAVRIRKYAGAAMDPEPVGEGSGYQTTTLTYDGHGRLQSRHEPLQNAGAATTYTYNADNMPLTVTDGRGAVTTYNYNNRHLVTGVTHVLSGTPMVSSSYQYDAAGNRTRMDDGHGWQTYSYDVLSRMSSETRYFNALGASYTLNYPSYTQSGQLKTLTDPFGAQFYYGYDAAGQVISVTGSAYAGITSYATGVQYRAWGEVKAATFGDGMSQTTAYDGRMRPAQYRLTGGFGAQRLDYAFNADDRLRLVTDLDDGQGSNPPATLRFWSQVRSYDHVGRIVHGGGVAQAPFQQSYGYDAFGNMTSRAGTYGYQTGQSDTSTYVNNRRQGWTYDADGRLILSPANSSSNRRDWTYDAAGRLVITVETAGVSTDTVTLSYDGDGRVVRESKTGGSAPGTSYLVRSTVFDGEVITRLTAAGAKQYTYVPAGRLTEARQSIDPFNNQPVVGFTHKDPTGTSLPGAAIDPLGNHVTVQNPQPGQQQPPMGMYGPSYFGASSSFGNANNYSTGCRLDGAPASCSSVQQAINSGMAVQCPNNDCGPQRMSVEGVAFLTLPFMAFANGVSGYFQAGFMEMGTPQEQAEDIFRALTSQSAGIDRSRNSMYINSFASQQNRGRFSTECQQFANIVEQIANTSSNADEFMKFMVSRFIGPNLDSRSAEDFDKAANVSNQEFGSDGFKADFVDGSNQVRHFTGGLWAGYLYGGGVGGLGMNSNEDNRLIPGRGVLRSLGGVLPTIWPTTGPNGARADIKLNSVSVPLGATLTPRKEQIVEVGDRGGWKKIPANPGYKGLAAAIRSQVCE